MKMKIRKQKLEAGSFVEVIKGDLKDNDNIKKSKCLEWKRVRSSPIFNFKT